MGGDGGVCANNRRFLRQAGMGEVKQAPKDTVTLDKERWTTCNYSKMPLKPPLVSDAVGQLYSKESILQAIGSKKQITPYAKKLKDFINMSPKVNELKQSVYDKLCAGEDDGSIEDYLDLYQCPLTLQTTNGRNKFCLSKTCGHVLAKRVLSELDGNTCPSCDVPTKFINLLPDLESLEQLIAEETASKESEKTKQKEIGGEKDSKEKKKKKKKNELKDKSVKKTKTESVLPSGATPDVWNSIFKKPGQQEEENYMCRYIFPGSNCPPGYYGIQESILNSCDDTICNAFGSALVVGEDKHVGVDCEIGSIIKSNYTLPGINRVACYAKNASKPFNCRDIEVVFSNSCEDIGTELTLKEFKHYWDPLCENLKSLTGIRPLYGDGRYFLKAMSHCVFYPLLNPQYPIRYACKVRSLNKDVTITLQPEPDVCNALVASYFICDPGYVKVSTQTLRACQSSLCPLVTNSMFKGSDPNIKLYRINSSCTIQYSSAPTSDIICMPTSSVVVPPSKECEGILPITASSDNSDNSSSCPLNYKIASNELLITCKDFICDTMLRSGEIANGEQMQVVYDGKCYLEPIHSDSTFTLCVAAESYSNSSVNIVALVIIIPSVTCFVVLMVGLFVLHKYRLNNKNEEDDDVPMMAL